MSIQSDDVISGQDPKSPNYGVVGAGPSRAILQRHIDAGEISMHDIEVINKAYYKMSTMGGLCTAVLGIGSYVWMSRTAPPIPRVRRILISASFGMVGSFVGWVLGGVGAYNDMSREITDPEGKFELMRQIAEETREALYEARRTGRPLPGARPERWDPAAMERQEERNREREAPREIGRIEGDLPETNTATRSSGIAQSVKQETTNTWDRLRANRPAAPTTSGPSSSDGAGSLLGPAGDDTRTQEQKEFDALLERERRGVDANDKWS